MRVLFVTQVVMDRDDGAARHVTAIARELAALGTHVDLVAPGREPTIAGVERIRPPSVLRPGLRMEAAIAGAAVFHAKRTHPDVALVRMSPTSSLAPAALSAIGVPIVLELNGLILEQLRASGRSERAIAVARAALRVVVRLSRTLIAPSPNVAEHAKRELGAHPILIENGADLEVATPGDRIFARRALGLDEHGRYLTITGKLVEGLRLDLLFAAHRELEGVTLLVVGDGPQRDLVRSAIEQAPKRAPIIALGAVSHDRSVLAIRAADVCINVHDRDLALKCLEYAAVGRRIVRFRVPGTERLASLYPDLEAVFLVEERSAAALRRAIESALEAETKRGALPEAAIATARATLGWAHTAKRIAEVLGRCASSS